MATSEIQKIFTFWLLIKNPTSIKWLLLRNKTTTLRLLSKTNIKSFKWNPIWYLFSSQMFFKIKRKEEESREREMVWDFLLSGANLVQLFTWVLKKLRTSKMEKSKKRKSFELKIRISPRKRIFQQNHFSLFLMGPGGSNFWKNLLKHLVKLPL